MIAGRPTVLEPGARQLPARRTRCLIGGSLVLRIVVPARTTGIFLYALAARSAEVFGRELMAIFLPVRKASGTAALPL